MTKKLENACIKMDSANKNNTFVYALYTPNEEGLAHLRKLLHARKEKNVTSATLVETVLKNKIFSSLKWL